MNLQRIQSDVESKSLNSPEPINRLMGETGYSGTANSTYETSKLASRGISAVAGLAALVGSAYSGMAQDVQPIAYKDTNLAEYGVPNFEGMTPYKTKHRDLSDKIPGAETRIDGFRFGDGFVATYSVDNKIYGIIFDVDGKRPLDYAFKDNQGDGVFEKVDPSSTAKTPLWVSR